MLLWSPWPACYKAEFASDLTRELFKSSANIANVLLIEEMYVGCTSRLSKSINSGGPLEYSKRIRLEFGSPCCRFEFVKDNRSGRTFSSPLWKYPTLPWSFKVFNCFLWRKVRLSLTRMSWSRNTARPVYIRNLSSLYRNVTSIILDLQLSKPFLVLFLAFSLDLRPHLQKYQIHASCSFYFPSQDCPNLFQRYLTDQLFVKHFI